MRDRGSKNLGGAEAKRGKGKVKWSGGSS